MASEPWLPLSSHVTLRKFFFNILCPWFIHLKIVTMVLNLVSFLWGPDEFSIGKALGLVAVAKVNCRISHHYNLNTSLRLREVGAASIIWGLPHDVSEDAGGAEAVGSGTEEGGKRAYLQVSRRPSADRTWGEPKCLRLSRTDGSADAERRGGFVEEDGVFGELGAAQSTWLLRLESSWLMEQATESFWSIRWYGGLGTKLCLTPATPWTVAHQAPLSMGFHGQEYWSWLPFYSPRWCSWGWNQLEEWGKREAESGNKSFDKFGFSEKETSTNNTRLPTG